MSRYQSATTPLSLDYDGYDRVWINLASSDTTAHDVSVIRLGEGDVTLGLDKDGRLLFIEIAHPGQVLTADVLAKLGLERS